MIRPRRHRSSGGQALVEFALVVGLFMLVVGGIVQFAVILWSQNTVNQIARDTARWAVTQSDSPCASAGMRANVATHANQLASQWQLIGPHSWSTASDDVDAVGPSGVGVEWYVDEDTLPPEITKDQVFPTDCPPSDNRLPWFVRVRVNQAVPIFFPGLQFISQGCAPGFCVSSTTELRMEPKRPE